MTVVDNAGNLIRTGILADTIRGYKGSGHKGEKARWLRNGVAYDAGGRTGSGRCRSVRA